VDRNYPAYRSGAPVIRVDSDLVSAVRAVLSVLPIDPETSRMQVADDPSLVHPQMTTAIGLARADGAGEVTPVPRFEFYELADEAAVVVLTRESESYGNILFTKGVINPS
jgi:L-fucose mutarotase